MPGINSGQVTSLLPAMHNTQLHFNLVVRVSSGPTHAVVTTTIHLSHHWRRAIGMVELDTL